jgi:hypothetical protein
MVRVLIEDLRGVCPQSFQQSDASLRKLDTIVLWISQVGPFSDLGIHPVSIHYLYGTLGGKDRFLRLLLCVDPEFQQDCMKGGFGESLPCEFTERAGSPGLHQGGAHQPEVRYLRIADVRPMRRERQLPALSGRLAASGEGRWSDDGEGALALGRSIR